MEASDEHPLALLAKEVEALADKEVLIFNPILARWNPQAQAISASLLHGLFHRELKPFVDGVSSLTADVSAVLPAADRLEERLKSLVLAVCEDGNFPLKQDLVPYQVEAVAGNIIMEWVNTQLSNVSGQVEKAVSEEIWEPVSSAHCGNSIYLVLNAIQEAVNQIFGLDLPMRVPLLRRLMNGIDNALQLYSNLVSNLGNIKDLIPAIPNLCRYRKDSVVKAFSRKKPLDAKLLDENCTIELSTLSTRKLCLRLNTLHHLLQEIDILEESIKERWTSRRPNDSVSYAITLSRCPVDEEFRSRHLSRSSEEFVIGFENSRKLVEASISKICEFAGAKIIFWDMRESFIEGLYKVSVSQSRVGRVISELDTVLGQLCEAIMEPLRDQVVLALLQASMNGLLRILLDGGSSRSFSQSDGELLEQDLNMLKNVFTADGDGLPKSVVDNAASPIEQVLGLYKAETWILIENFRRANDKVEGSNSQKFGVTVVPDADMLLRILCHRTDKEASKFLKKHCKVPKAAS